MSDRHMRDRWLLAGGAHYCEVRVLPFSKFTATLAPPTAPLAHTAHAQPLPSGFLLRLVFCPTPPHLSELAPHLLCPAVTQPTPLLRSSLQPISLSPSANYLRFFSPSSLPAFVFFLGQAGCPTLASPRPQCIPHGFSRL